MPKVFNAKFEGSCVECRLPIHVGDPVFFVERGKRDLAHERCGQPGPAYGLLVGPAPQPKDSWLVPPKPGMEPASQMAQSFCCPNCHANLLLTAKVVS